jgi:hypothetical protein
MYILGRITSRSSRSLAAMIGFSWVASNARDGRSGSPDDDAAITRGWHVLPLLSVFLPYPELVAAPRISRGAMSS